MGVEGPGNKVGDAPDNGVVRIYQGQGVREGRRSVILGYCGCRCEGVAAEGWRRLIVATRGKFRTIRVTIISTSSMYDWVSTDDGDINKCRKAQVSELTGIPPGPAMNVVHRPNTPGQHASHDLGRCSTAVVILVDSRWPPAPLSTLSSAFESYRDQTQVGARCPRPHRRRTKNSCRASSAEAKKQQWTLCTLSCDNLSAQRYIDRLWPT